MLRSFKNGTLKDPVARRVEERRLRRLGRIKSTVKARGHNKARRAAMRRLDRRASEPGLHVKTMRKQHLRDVTNRNAAAAAAAGPAVGYDQRTGKRLPTAEEILERAKRHAASQRLGGGEGPSANTRRTRPTNVYVDSHQNSHDNDDEIDEQNSFINDANDAEENELDASFDTLWAFHAERNNMDGEALDGDLEDVDCNNRGRDNAGTGNQQRRQSALDEVDDDDQQSAVSLIGPPLRGTSAKTITSENAGASSSRLGEDEQLAFQDAWSAATPIQLHGDHPPTENDDEDGVFGHGGRRAMSSGRSRTSRGSSSTGSRSRGSSGSRVRRARRYSDDEEEAYSLAGTEYTEDHHSEEDDHFEFEPQRMPTKMLASGPFGSSGGGGGGGGGSGDAGGVGGGKGSGGMWAPPNLSAFEKSWEKRGLPTWSSVNGTYHHNHQNQSRQHSSQSSVSSHSAASSGTYTDRPELNSLKFDPMSRARRRDSDPRDLLDELNGGGSLDMTSNGLNAGGSLGALPQVGMSMRHSQGRTNLVKPHYVTRTRAKPRQLKPMLKEGTRERRAVNKDRTISAPEQGNGRSWRGGGAADAHVADERGRVLKVRRREQKEARERARAWRARRLRKDKDSKANSVNHAALSVSADGITVADENTPPVSPLKSSAKTKKGSVLGESGSSSAPSSSSKQNKTSANARRQSPAKRSPAKMKKAQQDSQLLGLQAEKDEAAAMLQELMGSMADRTLPEQQHTHREDIKDDLGNDEHYASTKLAQSASSPAIRSPEKPAGPTSLAAAPLDVPALDLSGVDPSVSDSGESDEDEPLFD